MAAVPGRILAVYFRRGFSRADGRQLRIAWQRQAPACAQYIHVAVKGSRIGAIDGHQLTLAREPIPGPVGLGRDCGQRIAAAHGVAAAGGGCASGGATGISRCGAARGRGRRSRGRRGYRRRVRTACGGARCAPFHAAAARGIARDRRSDAGRARRFAREHRRIEQHGVFAYQMAAGPVDLYQHRRNRLVDSVRGVHVNDGAAVGGFLRLERDSAQKRRILQTGAPEGFARSQAHLEAGKLVRAGSHDVDISVEGRI